MLDGYWGIAIFVALRTQTPDINGIEVSGKPLTSMPVFFWHQEPKRRVNKSG
jgi:hypothetical protein